MDITNRQGSDNDPIHDPLNSNSSHIDPFQKLFELVSDLPSDVANLSADDKEARSHSIRAIFSDQLASDQLACELVAHSQEAGDVLRRMGGRLRVLDPKLSYCKTDAGFGCYSRTVGRVVRIGSGGTATKN